MIDKKYILLLDEDENTVDWLITEFPHIFREVDKMYNFNMGRGLMFFTSSKIYDKILDFMEEQNINYVFLLEEDPYDMDDFDIHLNNTDLTNIPTFSLN